MSTYCPECIRLIDMWNEANRELCRRTTMLAAVATCGDLLLYSDLAIQVEEARLRTENAHTAIQLHSASHRRSASQLHH